jgi:endonuclease/exonuclease/phosphatase family metal-dependent hydrolase
MTVELAAAFEARLGKRYPHRLFRPNPNAQGVGIASRYELSDGKVDMLGLRFLPSLSARVQGPHMQVHVACVHLIPPQAGFGQSDDLWATYRFNRSRRLAQVDALLNHLDGVEAPAIILGDMNEWPGQAAVTELTKAGFRDACLGRRSRCGPTWPGRSLNFPAAFRIDYILGRGVVFTDAAVIEAGGSDHYPVVAKIRPGGS